MTERMTEETTGTRYERDDSGWWRPIEIGTADIEPGIASLVAAAAVDWTAYRACPTCKAASGEACRTMSGRVVGGRPDGAAQPLSHAHVARVRRSGR